MKAIKLNWKGEIRRLSNLPLSYAQLVSYTAELVGTTQIKLVFTGGNDQNFEVASEESFERAFAIASELPAKIGRFDVIESDEHAI
jgi:hypothetical protein